MSSQNRNGRSSSADPTTKPKAAPAAPASPTTPENVEKLENAFLNRCHAAAMPDVNFDPAAKFVHMRRMNSLRKELDYLKETEWMYETFDKAGK